MIFGRQGIARTTFVSVAVATLAVVLAWHAVSLVIDHRRQASELVEAGGQVAARLAHTVAGPLWNFDLPEVEKVVAYELKRPELLAILVSNEKGVVVAGLSNPGPDGRLAPYRPSFDGGRLIAGAAASSDRSILRDEKPLGKVTVYVTDRKLRSDIAAATRKAVLQTFLLSSIIAFLAWGILSAAVVRPIRRLDASLSRVREGEFGRLEVEGAAELSRLASTFNAMTGRLEKAFDEQERLVAELRAHQEQFRSLAASVPGVLSRRVYSTRATAYLSDKFTAITGYARKDFFGPSPRFLRDIILPKDLPALEKSILEAGRTGKSYSAEFRIVDAQGSVRWIHETGSVTRGDDGEPEWIDGVSIDVTEEKAKEEQLRQAQKMESIGMLAGGIAHDFNNILTAVIGATSMIRLRQERDGAIGADKLDELVGVVESASDRAKGLVAQLLTLARRHEFQLVPLDLNASLRHVLKLLESTIDKSIRVELSEVPGGATISGDPIQIEQVLLNLCVNASHAMTFMRPGGAAWGGVLAMSVEPFHPTPDLRSRHPEAVEEKFWRVSIRDTGIGMTPEVQGKILTPFFTTKEQGKGSGLGLSMVYSIVGGHRGFMDVASAPGEGTTFSLFFPAAEPGGVEAPVGGNAGIPRGSGTVLVVDDEAGLRRLARMVLEESGFSILEAADGEEAVKLFRTLHEKIDLVLLDMVMPVMSGREAFFRLREVDPGARILLSTGFMQDARVQELVGVGVSGVIEKPYKVLALARKVVEMTAGGA